MRRAATLGVAAALAAVLSATGARLASSQVPTIAAFRVEGAAVPARDPWARFWDRVPLVDVALSAQTATPPMSGRRLTLRAGAVHDGERLYVLVEWPDARPDRDASGLRAFSDAAAVQFPAAGGQRIPAFCMGDPGATVNIWQWRAAWQADVRRGFRGTVEELYPGAVVDLYPFRGEEVFYPGRALGNPLSQVDRASAVDNLVAAGFGTLTPDPFPAVEGWGAWRGGRWRVVFSRPFSVGREGNVEFHVFGRTDVAFAVWDGGAGERDGMKSVSAFTALDVRDEALDLGPRFPYWPAPYFVVLALLALFGALGAADLRRGRRWRTG